MPCRKLCFAGCRGSLEPRRPSHGEASAGTGLILGSQRDPACRFQPDGRGRAERYVGQMTRDGLDLGTTRPSLTAWSMLNIESGRSTRPACRHLWRAGAEAAIAVGIDANSLIAGARDGMARQPVTVRPEQGLKVALGIDTLHLTRSRQGEAGALADGEQGRRSLRGMSLEAVSARCRTSRPVRPDACG